MKIKILTDFQFLGEECSDGNPNTLIISNISRGGGVGISNSIQRKKASSRGCEYIPFRLEMYNVGWEIISGIFPGSSADVRVEGNVILADL